MTDLCLFYSFDFRKRELPGYRFNVEFYEDMESESIDSEKLRQVLNGYLIVDTS